MQDTNKFRYYLFSGEPFVWITAGALAFCLVLLFGLLGLISINALSGFWPRTIEQFTLADGTTVYGERLEADLVEGRKKVKIKRANRDEYGLDFAWLYEDEIVASNIPAKVAVIERTEWGNFFGQFVSIQYKGQELRAQSPDFLPTFQEQLAQAEELREKIREIEVGPMEVVARNQESVRRELLQLERSGSQNFVKKAMLEDQQQVLLKEFEELDRQRSDLNAQLTASVVLRSGSGLERSVPFAKIEDYFFPNDLSLIQKIGLYLKRIFLFVWQDPREANTEGGVFPAIFGTVMLVFIMSIVVTPLGVLTAIYLHEYARPGFLVSAVRVAVNNLAGVPSIVFGVFGVGFFIYFVGAGLDQLFFSDSLPSPTFGTGGILWASLTLALLTVPTVIVATEEGLSAIPRHIREASYALGATKFETLCRVVLPALVPAILTGLILAVARAAGEVAPLMITGVVKLAPDLPFDGTFPFFHMDRKFMHLGFHIYDLGFQSPNVDAARPTVYATTLLLLLLVICLNAAAILVRNRLNKKLRVASI